MDENVESQQDLRNPESGITESSRSLKCEGCRQVYVLHSRLRDHWSSAPYDMLAALNGTLSLFHSSHRSSEREQGAWRAYKRLLDSVQPSAETLAESEESLRAHGFSEVEIVDANLDGAPPEGAAQRVAVRARVARMLLHALKAAEHAREVALHSDDPAADAAVLSIRVALLAMMGKRSSDLPPLDCLSELRAVLVHGERAREPGGDADLRKLHALVQDRVPYLNRFGLQQGAREEAKLLLSSIQRAFGEAFADLTEDACYETLRSYSRKRKFGRLTTVGMAAKIALQARAWGYAVDTQRDGDRLRRDITKALARG